MNFLGKVWWNACVMTALCATASLGQNIRFEHLSLEDGLSQSTVMAIVQDQQGFMWFATQDGLNRYDGYRFKVYSPIPFDTTSLADNFVRDVFEDRHGVLWAGTNSGLSKHSLSQDAFINFKYNQNDPRSLGAGAVNSVISDRTDRVWAGFRSSGLDRMDPASPGTFVHFVNDPADESSLSDNQVFDVYETDSGSIWVGTNNGLNKFVEATGGFERYFHASPDQGSGPGPGNVVNTIYQHAGDPEELWLGLGSGLARLNLTNGEITRYNFGDRPVGSITHDPIDENILWLTGRTFGLARFDISTGEYVRFTNEPGRPSSLASDDNMTVYTDRTGVVWVGSFSYGLSKFDPSSGGFRHYRNNPDNRNSIAGVVVWSVYEDRESAFWAGSLGSDGSNWLNRVDPVSGQVTRHRNDPDNRSSLSPGTVFSILRDRRGQLWVGTADNIRGGLNRFNESTGTFLRYGHDPNDAGTLSGNDVSWITEDNEGILWVATLRNGLNRFDPLTGRTKRYVNDPTDPGSLSSDEVTYVLLDSMNRLWVATYGGGVCLLLEDSDSFQCYEHDSRDPSTIASSFVNVILERANEPGVLWLGLSSGLNRLDVGTGQVTHWSDRDGLPNNVIYGILEDDDGHLWMSTNNEISRFDVEANRFRNYGLDDGLPFLEFSAGAFHRGKSEELYFGGLGLVTFRPDNLKENVIPPPVALTEFRLFNEPVVVGPNSPLKTSLSETKEIQLKHWQKVLSFDFVALHYTHPLKNEFAYRLDPFDADWVDAGHQRSATYTNLDPGRYVFRVKAANSDGVWNEEGVSVNITIDPPWWKTWWAYALYALALAAAVFAVDRLQRRRLSAKEKERAHLLEAELRAESAESETKNVELLSRIGRDVTSRLTIEKIIETVYENVNNLMDANVFSIGIYNEELRRIDFPATKEKGETMPPFYYELDDDRLASWCFRNEDEVVIQDYAVDHTKYVKAYAPPVSGGDPLSVLYLPLVHKEKVIGVISAQSFEKNAYTGYHLNILRNLATYTAIALDNAEAYLRLNKTLEDLQAAQTRLVQSEKMASLGQLTAGIAHEIKNPLNFVNNFAAVSSELTDELIEEIDKNMDKQLAEVAEELREILSDLKINSEMINEHGKRADGIVKSMLQHSRGGSGERTTTDVNALLEEYVNLAYHGMRAADPDFNSSIEKAYDETAGSVSIVPQDIGRVLINLLNNAFYAVNERAKGGEAGYAPTVTVRTKRTANGIEIGVRDNGTGIPDSVKAKIFEPFYTTKPTGSGTGLGLSMSYDIIAKGHGGDLKVDSKPGEFTQFVIILPSERV